MVYTEWIVYHTPIFIWCIDLLFLCVACMIAVTGNLPSSEAGALQTFFYSSNAQKQQTPFPAQKNCQKSYIYISIN